MAEGVFDLDRAKKLQQDYRWLASQLPGKRILRHLRGLSGQDTTSFVRGEPHSTHFNEGRRWVWVQIQTCMNYKEPKQVEEAIEES